MLEGFFIMDIKRKRLEHWQDPISKEAYRGKMTAYRAHGEPIPIVLDGVIIMDIMQGTPLKSGGPVKYWCAIPGIGTGKLFDTFDEAKKDGLIRCNAI